MAHFCLAPGLFWTCTDSTFSQCSMTLQPENNPLRLHRVSVPLSFNVTLLKAMWPIHWDFDDGLICQWPLTDISEWTANPFKRTFKSLYVHVGCWQWPTWAITADKTWAAPFLEYSSNVFGSISKSSRQAFPPLCLLNSTIVNEMDYSITITRDLFT